MSRPGSANSAVKPMSCLITPISADNLTGMRQFVFAARHRADGGELCRAARVIAGIYEPIAGTRRVEGRVTHCSA